MPIRTIAIAILASLVLAACVPATVVDTSCSAFQPIRYSARGDTPDTIAQVRAHNAAWDRLCK